MTTFPNLLKYKHLQKSGVVGLGVGLLSLFVLFAFGIVPLVQISFEVEALESQADIRDIALYAGAGLPYPEIAISRFQSYLSVNNLDRDKYAIRVQDGTLQISYRGSFAGNPLVNFLSSSLSQIDFTLAQATVGIVPEEIIIFFDTSKNVVPKILDYPNDPSSVAIVHHPEFSGHYTRHVLRKDLSSAGKYIVDSPTLQYVAREIYCIKTAKGSKRTACINDPKTRVLLSQMCFNPYFASIKETAYNLYDYFTAIRGNRVSVIRGPTAAAQIPGATISGGPSIEIIQDLQNEKQAYVPVLKSPDTDLGDHNCLYWALDATYSYLGGSALWSRSQEYPNGTRYGELVNDFRQVGLPNKAYLPIGLVGNRQTSLGGKNPVAIDAYDAVSHQKLIDWNSTIAGGSVPVSMREKIWSTMGDPRRSVQIDELGVVIPHLIRSKSSSNVNSNYLIPKPTMKIILLLGDYFVAGGSMFKASDSTEIDDTKMPVVRDALVSIQQAAEEKNVFVQIVMGILRSDLAEDADKINCRDNDNIEQHRVCAEFYERFYNFEQAIERIDRNLSRVDVIPWRIPHPGSMVYGVTELRSLMDKELYIY